jgi:GcrA cell cycle regulator
MTDAGVTWTDERVELLKKLWSDGLSASQIAAEIGGVTRNAVIGKVHRLGLSGRGKAAPAPAQRARKATRAPSAPTPIAEPAARSNVVVVPVPAQLEIEPEPMMEVSDDVVVPISERVTIMDLRESMCRWPMGDPTKPDFRFCGARSVTGLPYCGHHARIAYQPVADRKRDRRFARA